MLQIWCRLTTSAATAPIYSELFRYTGDLSSVGLPSMICGAIWPFFNEKDDVYPWKSES
ncbi:hypothetical protein Q0M94_04020 [Deinococcus radiomollis]|uniref:hypothetical protein n=1 Tax=Deinococcus radiomollis TaxID=468916 RepID=UPI003891406D